MTIGGVAAHMRKDHGGPHIPELTRQQRHHLRVCGERLSEARAVLARVMEAERALADAHKELWSVCPEASAGTDHYVASQASWTRPHKESDLHGTLEDDEDEPELVVDGSERSPTRAAEPNKSHPALIDQVILSAIDQQESQLVRRHSPGAGPMHHSSKRCCGVIPMLHPAHPFLSLWSTIGLLCVVYESVVIPFDIGFEFRPQGIASHVVDFVNVFFICDIVLRFITGYKNQAGSVVMNPTRVAKNYARGWLLTDVLAGIPWEWLPSWMTYAKVCKLLRFTRFTRILRVLNIRLLPDRARIAIDSNPLLTFLMGILRVLSLLVAITHWTACGWYMVGTMQLGEDVGSWVKKYVPQGAGIGVQYMYSCFFSLTTMTTVGYGDITAQNPYEVAYVIMLLLVAAIIFPGIMGAITDLLASINSEEREMTTKMQVLSQYMRWRNVPTGLFMNIRKHLHYQWSTNKGYDLYEEELKCQLSPILKKELCHHVYSNVLRSVPFFAWIRDLDKCLKELANVAHTVILSKGDSLFHVGQANEEMYILVSGTVRISLNESLHHGELDFLEAKEEEEDDEDAVEAEIEVAPQIDASGSPDTRAAEKALLILRKATRDTAKKRRPSRTGMYSNASSFRSPVLEQAAVKLENEDDDKEWFAKLIQQRWRKSRKTRLAEQQGKSRFARTTESRRRSNRYPPSTSVAAPAYFGESCLWLPREEWHKSAHHLYMYNARCEQRCELVQVTRKAVSDLLDRFSPWLAERFEFFSKAVVEHAQAMATPHEQEVSKQPDEENVIPNRIGTAAQDERTQVVPDPSLGHSREQLPSPQNHEEASRHGQRTKHERDEDPWARSRETLPSRIFPQAGAPQQQTGPPAADQRSRAEFGGWRAAQPSRNLATPMVTPDAAFDSLHSRISISEAASWARGNHWYHPRSNSPSPRAPRTYDRGSATSCPMTQVANAIEAAAQRLEQRTRTSPTAGLYSSRSGNGARSRFDFSVESLDEDQFTPRWNARQGSWYSGPLSEPFLLGQPPETNPFRVRFA